MGENIIQDLIKQGDDLNRQFVGHTKLVSSRRVSVEDITVPLTTVRVTSLVAESDTFILDHLVQGRLDSSSFKMDVGFVDSFDDSLSRVVSYKDNFKEHFYHSGFVDSSVSTGSQDTSAGTMTLTNAEVFQSKIIAYDGSTAFSKATISASGTDYSSLSPSVSFDGGSSFSSAVFDSELEVSNSSTSGLVVKFVNPTSVSSLSSSIVSYWKFDVDSSTQVDSVGSNSLTNNGASYDSSGLINADYSYTTNDYMIKSSPTGLKGLSAFSISLWVKFSSLPSLSYLVCYGDPDSFTAASWFVRQQGSQLYCGLYSDTGTSVLIRTASNTFVTGQYYHVVFAWEANNVLKIYVDGVDTSYTYAVGSGIPPDMESTPSDDNLRFGVDDAAYYLEGNLDEVGCWSKALSSSEVSELYNSGVGFQYPFETSMVLSGYNVKYS